MSIKAVVFDIGNVLEFNPRTGWMDKWNAKLGLQPGEMNQRLDEVWRGGSIGTIPLEEVHRRIGEIMGMSEADVNALMDDSWVEYVGTLNEELVTYFASLRPKYKTAILSNSFVGAREREQALYGFEEMCDLIVYSHEVGMGKPDPRIFHLTCERLGVLPAEVVFLDDVEGHVLSARACGLNAIVFQDNAQAIAEIEALLTG